MPRYDKYHPKQVNIHYPINNEVSIKHFRSFVEKEIDVGCIHHYYFNVPNHLMICTQTEVLEGIEDYSTSIPVEKFIRYYVDIDRA